MPVPTTLRTERLLLRAWRAGDAAALRPVLEANQPHLGPWIPARVATPAPLPELAERLAGFAADFQAGREWRYGLFAPDEGRVLGEVGLFPRAGASRVPYAEADHVEIGYWLRADATGQGLATEAARAAFAVAAALPGLSHAEIRCDARNGRSAAVPQRLGFALATSVRQPALVPTDPPVELQVWTHVLPRDAAPDAEGGAMEAGIAASPAVFYASRSGRPTLDQGEGGGNPFASALVELLARPALTYAELRAGLVGLTREKSRGFQEADAPAVVAPGEWHVTPTPAAARRVALVLVYADYREAGVTSLPGARQDLRRVQRSLERAGFEVHAIEDPTRDALRTALRSLARRSVGAEAAAIYLTGHGFEHEGEVFLMPNDYPFDDGPGRLRELAVHVPGLGDHLRAETANMIFFGGCRSHW